MFKINMEDYLEKGCKVFCGREQGKIVKKS